MKLIGKLIKFLRDFEQKYLLLMIAITILVILSPFISSDSFGNFVYKVIFSVVLIMALYGASEEQKNNRITQFMGITAIVLNWLPSLEDGSDLATAINPIQGVFFAIFFILVTVSLITHITKSNQVDANILYGSITGYLLIGITGAVICGMIEFFYPASFNFTVEGSSSFHHFIYFSFVTLSSLGYGDFTPISAQAQVFSVMLSTLGQFYMTILVAILVSKYLISKHHG
jgi:hypothetical protein